MNKISANVSEKGIVDLDFTVKENIYNLCDNNFCSNIINYYYNDFHIKYINFYKDSYKKTKSNLIKLFNDNNLILNTDLNKYIDTYLFKIYKFKFENFIKNDFVRYT